MAAKVRIDEIVTALEDESEMEWVYVNVETGKVETVLKDDICDIENSDADEEEEDEDEDEDEELKLLKEITWDRKKWKRLPTRFDLHDWSIMENFAESLTSPEVRSDLQRALHQRGSYGNFRDRVDRYRLKRAWDAFRIDALRDIAIEWCEDHDIPYE